MALVTILRLLLIGLSVLGVHVHIARSTLRRRTALRSGVPTAAAFDRRVDGRTLDFRPAGTGVMTDVQTGSRWDITGRALAGPLHGAQLRRLPDLNAFWFAVAAFVPHARLVPLGSGS